jgi:fructose-1,6-bisphosphatase/inositol monophosphatase family enzyme
MFSTRHVTLLANILRDAAIAEVLPRFRNLTAGQIRHKSSVHDLVTDGDEAAEAYITRALNSAFPGAVVIGEEGTAKDASILDQLGGADLAFVVDPIDGTKNFASGLPLFGVMASVVQKGTIVAGIIYDPIVDDWAIGLRGEGAWLERTDGKRSDLRVAAPAAPSAMLGMCSWLFMPPPLRSIVTRNLPHVGGAVDYRTAAHEYRLVAGGHYHFLMFWKLMPWDHAAGWLIHREAGGYGAHFDGSEYDVTHLEGGLLCAPDKATWESLREALLTPPQAGAS